MTTPQKAAALAAFVVCVGLGFFATVGSRRPLAGGPPADPSAKVAAAQTAASPPAGALSSPAAPVAPPAAPADPALSPDLRVVLLKQLLEELPGQRLPELRLLALSDWLEIARTHELDSAADIRVALADLRAVARKKFAPLLQEALRQFLAASSGQLPTGIGQLSPYLAAPADAEMLARYDLLRSGKIGEPTEKIIREKSTSDMILSLSLDGWSMSNNSEQPAAFGESEGDALDRAWRVLGSALGDEAKAKMATMASPRVLGEVMEGAVETLASVYGSAEAVGDALKAAARHYLTAHPGETISDVAQILPFLQDSERFLSVIRPALAELQYLREHGGQRPADPNLLRPYLAGSFEVAALRELKLKWDGEHLSLTYSWSK